MTQTTQVDNSVVQKISNHTGKPVATEQEKYGTYKRLEASQVVQAGHYKQIGEALNKWATSEAAETKEEVLGVVAKADIPTFDDFLATLPEEVRQLNNCNCCHDWYNRNANVVIVNKEGKTRSLYWDVDSAPEEFKQFVSDVKVAVESVEVIDFYEIPLGKDKPRTDVTLNNEVVGYFVHWHNGDLSVNARGLKPKTTTPFTALMTNFASTLPNDGAVQTSCVDLRNRIMEIDPENTVVVGHLAMLAAYADLSKIAVMGRRGDINKTIAWNKAFYIYATFSTMEHFNGSAIGKAFRGYQNSAFSIEDAVKNYYSSIDSTKYMRKIADASDNRIREAEQFLESKNYGESLKIGQISIDEYVESARSNDALHWEKKDAVDNTVEEEKPSGGLLSSLYKTKRDEVEAESKPKPTLPVKNITISRFIEEVLPKAIGVKIKMERPDRYGSLSVGRVGTMKIARHLNFNMKSGVGGPPVWMEDLEAVKNGKRRNHIGVCVDVRISQYLDNLSSFWSGFNFDGASSKSFDVKAIVTNTKVSGKDIPESIAMVIPELKFVGDDKLTPTCYPETLTQELKPYRDVLEQYMRVHKYVKIDESKLFCSFTLGQTELDGVVILVETEDTVEQYNVYMSH